MTRRTIAEKRALAPALQEHVAENQTSPASSEISGDRLSRQEKMGRAGGADSSPKAGRFLPACLETVAQTGMARVRVWGHVETYPLSVRLLRDMEARERIPSIQPGMALAVELGTTWLSGQIEVKQVTSFAQASRQVDEIEVR